MLSATSPTATNNGCPVISSIPEAATITHAKPIDRPNLIIVVLIATVPSYWDQFDIKSFHYR